MKRGPKAALLSRLTYYTTDPITQDYIRARLLLFFLVYIPYFSWLAMAEQGGLKSGENICNLGKPQASC